MYKDSAKTIVCYGDSNTWGADPRPNAPRHLRSIRYPYALQNLLGDDYEVISEGLCGRTLVGHDPEKPRRTGITHLESILDSARPVDLVIVNLGTNDAKAVYNLSPEQIAEYLQQTIDLIRDEEIENIIVVCPAQAVTPESGELEDSVKRIPEILEKLPPLYEEVAKKNNCGYINAEDHIKSSVVDGFHLDPEAHLKLAEVLRDKIKELGI